MQELEWRAIGYLLSGIPLNSATAATWSPASLVAGLPHSFSAFRLIRPSADLGFQLVEAVRPVRQEPCEA